jgi:hypothetical protein
MASSSMVSAEIRKVLSSVASVETK